MAYYSTITDRRSTLRSIMSRLVWHWLALAWLVWLAFQFYPRLPELFVPAAASLVKAWISSQFSATWSAIQSGNIGLGHSTTSSLPGVLWNSGLKELVPLSALMLLALFAGSFWCRRLLPTARPCLELLLVQLGLGLGGFAYSVFLVMTVGLQNRFVPIALAITWAALVLIEVQASLSRLSTTVRNKIGLAINSVGAAHERRGGSRAAPTRGRLSNTTAGCSKIEPATSNVGAAREPPLPWGRLSNTIENRVSLIRAVLRGVRGPWHLFSVSTVAIILVFSAIGLVGALAPETEYDALWYHLYLPKLYLQEGKMMDVPEEYVAQYPLNVEMLYALGLLWRGETLAKLINYMFGILDALLAYRLARSVASRQASLLAAAVFLSTPTVLWEMTTAYNELGLTFFISLSLLGFLNSTRFGAWQWLAISALAMGIALGIKHLALFALAGASSWILFRGDLTRLPSLASLRDAGLYSAATLAIASPWYVKSWIITGNPVFPLLYRWFPTSESRWNENVDRGLNTFLEHFGPGRDPIAVLGVLWDLTLQPWRYDGELGPIFLALAPFAVLAARKAGTAAFCLIWFCAIYIALWASPVSSFQMRFLVPMVPALSALVALAYDWLTQHHLRLLSAASNWLLRIGVIALLFANLPWFADFHGPRDEPWENYINSVVRTVPFGVVSGSESRFSYLSRTVAGYRAVQYANKTLPSNARILSFFGALNYHSARKIVVYHSPSVPPVIYSQNVPDDAALVSQLRASGFTHVLFDKKMWRAEARDYAVVRQSLFDSYFIWLYDDQEALLYELP